MTELAKLYGESLYDLAAEETLEVRILEELDGAAACIKAEPDYLRLLSTPSVLGGLRLDLDGTRLDGTVRRRLDAIRTDIGSAVL